MTRGPVSTRDQYDQNRASTLDDYISLYRRICAIEYHYGNLQEVVKGRLRVRRQKWYAYIFIYLIFESFLFKGRPCTRK